jgi:pyrroline-5-carboxylate reductase
MTMTMIGFIGAGNMASALLGGVATSAEFRARYPKCQLAVSDINTASLERLQSQIPSLTVFKDNVELTKAADCIVLAIKPQLFSTVLPEIGPATRDKLVISIAAGITLHAIRTQCRLARLVRIMPNTPCLVGQGMSAIAFDPTVSDSERALVNAVFSAVGEVLEVDEDQINAVTGLSGSGPAFVYEVADALIAGGVAVGLSLDAARHLAAQTLVGAGTMLLKKSESTADLVRQVASPGGTTVAGLEVLSQSPWKTALTEAVIAAKRRADELSKGGAS